MELDQGFDLHSLFGSLFVQKWAPKSWDNNLSLCMWILIWHLNFSTIYFLNKCFSSLLFHSLFTHHSSHLL
ncbi:hypothetical protein ACJX0J_030639, partial [Zea mays]